MYYFVTLVSGGGCYTMSGLKEGLWQDIKCHMGYKTEVIL